MSSKTKIVVLHMKDVIYTVLFLGFMAILGILLFIMFRKSPDSSADTEVPRYKPGIYASTITLSDSSIDVAVTVDSDRIKDISLIHLNESVAAMYPLMEPTLEDIAYQIYEHQSTDEIVFSDDSLYTSTMLLKAIDTALEKAMYP